MIWVGICNEISSSRGCELYSIIILIACRRLRTVYQLIFICAYSLLPPLVNVGVNKKIYLYICMFGHNVAPSTTKKLYLDLWPHFPSFKVKVWRYSIFLKQNPTNNELILLTSTVFASKAWYILLLYALELQWLILTPSHTHNVLLPEMLTRASNVD